MNLRKRAISGIMLAGSMVVMCAIADAASTVSAEAVAVVADTRTDLATDGTAGVVAQWRWQQQGLNTPRPYLLLQQMRKRRQWKIQIHWKMHL